MIFLLFIIIGPFLFIVLRNTIGLSKKENSLFEKIILGIYLAIVCFFILILVGAEYNYYLRGYRSTSIFFLVMVCCGMIYWFTDRRKVFTNISRAVLFCFSILTIAVSPFLIALIVGKGEKPLVYNSQKYRLEISSGFLAPCMLPNLFLKKGLFERQLSPRDSMLYPCVVKEDISNVKTEPLHGNRVSVTYFLSAKRTNDLPDSMNVIYYEK